MTNLKIRNATKEDIDDIVLLEKSFPSEIYSQTELLKMFSIDYYRFLVAEIDDKIVGYLCSTFILDECNLLKIIIDKDYKRKGIGRELILYLKEDCQIANIKTIFLEVSVDNASAICFYEKLGFKYLSFREKYYNGIDAKIYEMSV